MKQLTRIAWSILVFLSITPLAHSQTIVSEFLGLDSTKKSLFVHVDKTVYTNEEDIWFSAYLLKSTGIPASAHSVLTVSLIQKESKTVILQDKFAMQNGLSVGSLHIPDTIAPARYDLLFNTNVVNADSIPQAIFSQPLTIKNINRSSLKAHLAVIDTNTKSAMRFALRGFPAADIKRQSIITYNVGTYRRTVTMTTKATEYIISLPDSITQKGYEKLLVKLSYNNDDQFLEALLPKHLKAKPSVKFFPEGGDLVIGLSSSMAFEVRNGQGSPFATEAELWEDSRLIQTVSTNQRGFGMFQLTPVPGKSYTVKLKDAPDLVSDIPKILSRGAVLSIAEPVVNDTLKARVFSANPTKVQVYLHNGQDVYAKFLVEANATGSRTSIILAGVPKGIVACTIVDQEDRPLAEELFFAHYDWNTQGEIQLDKKEHGKREKVSLSLNAKDKDGKPFQGVVSVAVVQSNRLSQTDFQDIRDYKFLGDLGTPQKDILGNSLQNRDLVRELLRSRGWRRYTWQSLRTDEPAEKPLTINGIYAQVLNREKPLKDSVSVTILNASNSAVLQTDTTGLLYIPESSLLSEARKNLLLSVARNVKDNYSIRIQDQYFDVSNRLVKKLSFRTNTLIPPSLKSQGDTVVYGIETLKTVSINSNDGSFFGKDKSINECGDFVNSVGYLYRKGTEQYPNQLRKGGFTQAPVAGKTYIDPDWIKVNGETVKRGTVDMGTIYFTVKIIYQGCDIKSPYIFPARGIYSNMEFYGMADAADRQHSMQSTLFWQPGILMVKDKTTDVSFFTGEITGDFKIIIQGVSNDDVLFLSEKFTVK